MKKLLKWTALVLGGLIVLVLIAGVTLYTMGSSKANQTYEVTGTLTAVQADSAVLAYGGHLSLIHACRECHGENLGGQVMLDIPPFLAVASNLTSGRGGIGATYTDADWDRTIRYGVKPDGRAVFVMPSKVFHNMSDQDANALIAYLKNLPPVDNELPPSEIRPPALLMAAAGAFDLAEAVHTAPHRAPAPDRGPTAAYGAYLTTITCIYCHGEDLRGGPSPNPDLPGPDLAIAGSWPFDVFATTIRTGVNPGGKQLDPEFMPWRAFKHMTDDELKAMHLHLQTLAN